MLRLTVKEDPETVTIKLEGRLAGWVGEFECAWRSFESCRGSKKFNLDLRDVSFVDSEGRRLMRETHEKTGTAFLANSPLMKHFAEEAARASAKVGHNGG